MVRRREFDEDKALEAAMIQFWEKGYEAVSLTDLTNAMGIQRPSLYSAFGDKKELFEAALRRYMTTHASRTRAILQNESSTKEAFRTLFDGIIRDTYEGNGNRGCFCINTMVEFAPHDEKFEVLTREHQMYLSVIFQETIERGQRSGELDPTSDARALARVLVVSLIGLTVLMKSRPDRSFAEQSVAVTLSFLK